MGNCAPPDANEFPRLPILRRSKHQSAKGDRDLYCKWPWQKIPRGQEATPALLTKLAKPLLLIGFTSFYLTYVSHFYQLVKHHPSDHQGGFMSYLINRSSNICQSRRIP